MTGVVTVVGALALAALGACTGTDEAPPGAAPIEGTPKQQIAATARQMFEAWNAGDGEQTCSYLTERGRTGMVKIARRLAGFGGDADMENCPEAAVAIGEESEGPIGQTVSAQDVSLLGPRTAQVNSEFGTALPVREIDGRWLVQIPFFIN